MHERDENDFRRLCTTLRENDPATFIGILVDTLLNRTEDGRLAMLRHYDDENKIDGCLVICKGAELAAEVEESLLALKAKLERPEGVSIKKPIVLPPPRITKPPSPPKET